MKHVWLLPLFCSALFAQNDTYANINLQLPFQNPGARAKAMGGAFVGLADDSTAIFANPAGLTQMSSTSLVGEFSSSSADNPIPFYSGSIDRVGLQDFDFNLTSRDFSQSATSLPFLGYVNTKSKLKWGVYYANLGNLKRDFETLGVGIPPTAFDVYAIKQGLFYYLPSRNSLDLKLETVGVSAAKPFGEHFSIGATLSYERFQYQAQSTLLLPDFEALFPDINFDPRQIEALRPFYGKPLNQVSLDGSDTGLGVYAGMLFTPSARFSVGLSYKHQPKFDYDYEALAADGNFDLQPAGTGVSQFNVPDNFAIGTSFKPNDFFVVSVEVNRVFHSELMDDFFSFYRQSNDPVSKNPSLDDTTEIHVGGEYVLVNFRFPLSIRAGYWKEPFHGMKNPTADSQSLFRYVNDNGDYVLGQRPSAFLHRFEKDQNHISFGLGLSIGSHWAADLTGDFAEEGQEISLSSIYRF